ncbi:hypothetical protein ACF0H5_020589 [Mactra antiquata]
MFQLLKVTTVILIYVLIISMATTADNKGDNSGQLDDIPADVISNVVLPKTECVYDLDSAVLNCSNTIFDANLKVMNNISDAIQVFDITNASLDRMITFKDYQVFEMLEVLQASYNNIKELPEDIFDGLKYVEKINLSHNNITTLPAAVFAKLSDLKSLDLSYNFLTTLPTIIPMLEWFDVSYNQIKSLSEEFSSVLYPQRIVLIAGNPFICDCKVAWLKEWFNTRIYLIKYSTHIDVNKFIPSCSKPDNLVDKRWDILSDADFQCSDEESDKENNGNAVDDDNDLKVSVVDIKSNSVTVKWQQYSKTSSYSLEISIHRFGKSKDAKKTIIPLTAGSYKLKNLEQDSPYVICFSLIPKTSVTFECEEIMTSKLYKETSKDSLLLEVMVKHITENIYQIVTLILVLFVSLYYILNKVNFDSNKNKEKSET